MDRDENNTSRVQQGYSWLRQGTVSPSIRYGTLGLVFVSLAIGFIASMFVFNSDDSQTVFSVVELITFTLSIFLSSASIVLAISAIALGKSSENILIKRSDDSIRIQNEVFSKTTEALSRIESSTGVTEKRIEDIIAGRAGDISQSIIEQFEGSGKGSDSIDFQAMEEKLRKTIVDSLENNGRTERINFDKEKASERRRKRLEDRKRYHAAHDQVFSRLINSKHPEILKVPQHGSVGATGEDSVDAMFLINGERLGISTFSPEIHEDNREAVYLEYAKTLDEGVVDKMCLIFFSEDEDVKPSDISGAYGKFFDDRIVENIRLYVVGYEHLAEVVDCIEWL